MLLLLFILGIFVICLIAFLCLLIGSPKVNYFDEGDPRNDKSRVDKKGRLVWMEDYEEAFHE